MTDPQAAKRRGRPPGPGKKTGPREGSRPHALGALGAGDSLWVSVPGGRTVAAHMSQIQVDFKRAGGRFTQAHYIAVQPTTREVVDLIRVTRVALSEVTPC